MSLSLTKVSLSVVGLGFIAYCVYFDRKRRSAPDFKEKLREKRREEKKNATNKMGESEIPIFTDPTEMQAFFLQEVQLSDELMQTGKFEEAVVHLANAAVVCSQKSEFLGVMQKTLPPSVFQLLIQYYQVANEKYIKKVLQDQALSKLSKVASGGGGFIDDTDIE